ncbi:MAG TPA: SIR2 family protein [Chloroflexota bacterium]
MGDPHWVRMQLQSFAALLKDYRLVAGLTQEALADRAGVSARTVSDLERGLYLAPHRETVGRLVEALELTADDRALLEAAISRSRGPSSTSTTPADAAANGSGPRAHALPTGVLTLLMVDIDTRGAAAETVVAASRRYDEVLARSLQGRIGVIVPEQGQSDGRLIVFQSTAEAVAAALEVQGAADTEAWPARPRVALYAGETDQRDGVYFGGAATRCTRLRGLAAPGQTLVSESVWHQVRGVLPKGARTKDLGEHQLSDHGQPERLFELVPPGVGLEFPALRSPSLLSHYETVLRGLLDGRVVLFVGDGISQPRDAWHPGTKNALPATADLARALADDFGYPDAAPHELARVAQYVATLAGSGPLYEKLHALLDVDYPPTIVHHFLAQLPRALTRHGRLAKAPLIVTTSYDQCFEAAFASAAEPLDVVAYVAERDQRGHFVHRTADGRTHPIDRPNRYLGLSEARTILLKVHGAVDRLNPEQDSFVVTEDHFLDYATGGDISNAVPVTIAARLRRSHFLFLGYGLRDWNLRVILRRLWGEQRLTYKSWSVHAGAPEPIERGLWRERGVDIVDVNLSAYLAGLEERLQALPVTEATR